MATFTKDFGCLDGTFHRAFKSVKPTGKNLLLGLDVSSSMNIKCPPLQITPRAASAAMAMVLHRVEKYCLILGFSHKLMELKLGKYTTIN